LNCLVFRIPVANDYVILCFILQRLHYTPRPFPLLSSFSKSSTTTTPSNKNPIAVLTSALSISRTLDTVRAVSFLLTLSRPKESPTIVIRVRHLSIGGSRTSVGRTSAVRSSVRGIVLVVCDEDGEGLGGGGTGVVGAFSGLDGGGDF